ncbi:hypothetical protein [Amycolatopsis sp. Hca4]|uniref:hypothetical protein n=1 Tax=Amycolatopsis sp. Hca4 TaxID=2742131 RepID=UPI0015925AF9|nr:hypothetical protein [Amycolatopsis sp. Hca4]QKV76608.1 hypothetical protein HUT10_24670 [Amycolatopsis sp. Hca4]
MGELIGVLLANLLPMIDMTELFGARRRRTRAAASARGERVEYPCVLRSEELTSGTERRGWLVVGDGPVRWRWSRAEPVVFEPGELTMQAVDRQAVTFHAGAGRTELRLHPDEAGAVLRALGR